MATQTKIPLTVRNPWWGHKPSDKQWLGLERVSREGEDYRPCGDHNVVCPRPLMFSSWRVFPGTKRPESHRGRDKARWR